MAGGGGHQLPRDLDCLLEDRERADCNEGQMRAEETMAKARLRDSGPRGQSRYGAQEWVL